jgi:membrane protein DedA with SNARE-associated domain
MYKPNMAFGTELLFVAIIAEIIGISVLYLLASQVKIPRRIETAAKKYVGFLALGDERLLLLNRVAPMIPFCGAMIRILGWNVRKSLLYVVIGCIVKYGAIMAMSDFFFDYFSGDDAQMFTLIFIALVIVISVILSFAVKKRREEAVD